MATTAELLAKASLLEEALRERLRGLHPIIEKILAVSGTAGASVGIIRRGETFHEAHFGFRDHKLSTKPDSDTLYGIGSMTKGMVAAAIADLVERGLMAWDEKLCDIMPEFTSPDRVMADGCTVADILSHRSGLPTFNVLWYQGNALPLIPKSALLPMVSVMKPAFGLRSGWRYSNWGYALAGEAVARRTGAPFEQQLQQALFDPLGIKRTTLRPDWREDGNTAESFIGYNDASMAPIRSQVVDQTTVMAAAGGVCSSTKQLLVYYTALLKALSHQLRVGTPLEGSPFKQLAKIFSGHVSIPLRLSTIDEYGLGWFRGYAPGFPGILSENNGLLPKLPVIGEGAKPQFILSHNRTLAGFSSTVFLLPETESGIFVLTNTKSTCDSGDLIAKALLHTLLGSPAEIDFINLAETAMRAGTEPMSLETYEGRYYWDTDAFVVDISLVAGISTSKVLTARMQGLEDQTYTLQHYHYDTFTWLMTDKEEAKRSRVMQAVEAYKFVFERNEANEIYQFVWQEMGAARESFAEGVDGPSHARIQVGAHCFPSSERV
ncbi:beta-lactamase/transpeptidase-like protein [Podospora aff. communis PSN243]|uniref:Beta-lactamase/transpeptidase-like protein n=1 Tax=Podospora aff. communis PSN243 TaxID=3040156 RepID=A0AAV9H3B6_9PEZI|nr:beta-lactamase/transpeptidase-like protein [Podospora aff. communis PSN243]